MVKFMKSNYERHRYWGNVGIISGICLMCTWIIGKYVLSLGQKDMLLLVGLMVVVLVGVQGYSYICYNQLLLGIEEISKIMMEVVEGKDAIKEEEYKQGTLGIFYTNFYKMVQSLKESRSKERKEKEFLRDVISDISHQLKTPLASLKVFTDLLLEEKVSDPVKRKNMLAESANQLNRMEWMVQSMLKLARIEAGSIQFSVQKVNVNAMMSQVAEAVKYLVSERKQFFHWECDESLILDCDGDWLTEAIINLVKNASDYSQEGKNIWFDVEQNAMFTRLFIRDEGMGISEEQLPHIFKRFYRVHQEVNPNSVGIGLSLSKSIVEGMDGRLTVRSEEGVGTTFMITFVKNNQK